MGWIARIARRDAPNRVDTACSDPPSVDSRCGYRDRRGLWPMHREAGGGLQTSPPRYQSRVLLMSVAQAIATRYASITALWSTSGQVISSQFPCS